MTGTVKVQIMQTEPRPRTIYLGIADAEVIGSSSASSTRDRQTSTTTTHTTRSQSSSPVVAPPASALQHTPTVTAITGPAPGRRTASTQAVTEVLSGISLGLGLSTATSSPNSLDELQDVATSVRQAPTTTIRAAVASGAPEEQQVSTPHEGTGASQLAQRARTSNSTGTAEKFRASYAGSEGASPITPHSQGTAATGALGTQVATSSEDCDDSRQPQRALPLIPTSPSTYVSTVVQPLAPLPTDMHALLSDMAANLQRQNLQFARMEREWEKDRAEARELRQRDLAESQAALEATRSLREEDIETARALREWDIEEAALIRSRDLDSSRVRETQLRQEVRATLQESLQTSQDEFRQEIQLMQSSMSEMTALLRGIQVSSPPDTTALRAAPAAHNSPRTPSQVEELDDISVDDGESTSVVSTTRPRLTDVPPSHLQPPVNFPSSLLLLPLPFQSHAIITVAMMRLM